MLVTVPADPVFTTTPKLQDVLGASVAADSDTEVEPENNPVRVPPQVLDPNPATVRPPVRLSLKATEVNVVEPFGFWRLKVNVDCTPNLVAPELNEAVMTGGAIPDTGTVREAVLLVAPVPLSLEKMLPVVLLNVPVFVGLVTVTLKLHDPPAPSPPPDRLTDVDPAVMLALPAGAPTVPPQVFVDDDVATCRPIGNVSVTATPVSAVEPLGLLMLKVNVDVPLSPIVPGENDLLMVGGAAPPPGTV